MEKKTNYIEKKDQARKFTLLLTYKGESQETNTSYLDIENNHNCGLKNMFVELDESKKMTVTFRDSFKILVKLRQR